LVVCLLFCMYLAVRRGVGAWYFRQGAPDAIQAAMNWDPGNARYDDAMGTLLHLYASGGNSKEIVELYRTATHLSPYEAQFWEDLGESEDWAGDSAEAEADLQHARRLFPNSPEINWRLANFYVRAGRSSAALESLQKVLAGDPALHRSAFALAARATDDSRAIVGMLPVEAPIFFDYLNFQIDRGDFSAAQEAWARILELNLPFDLSDGFPYLDALIQHKNLPALQDAWAALSQRFPARIGARAPDLNLVTNGTFVYDIVNGGLDWRIIPSEGAVVALENLQGGRALRITFDGSRNLDYGQVFQYVPVQPNTRYAFAGRMRVQGITTDSGPRFQIRDGYKLERQFAATENLVGTTVWVEERAEFRTGPDTRLLLISVARPESEKFESKIAGSVWIDDVNLSKIIPRG